MLCCVGIGDFDVPDLQPYVIPATYLGGAFAVLLVLYVLASLFRRSRRGSRSQKGMRLGINEFCEIDETRRLVLVRRDNVEHLVLIGGPQDLVIESGIGAIIAEVKHPMDAAMATVMDSAEHVVPFKAAPRAPVFAVKRPSLRSVDNTDENGDPNMG